MRRMSGRNALILGLVAIGLLVALLWVLLIGPLLGRLDARAEEREEKEAQLADLQQEIEGLEAVRQNAPDIERQLLEYSKRIPTQPQIETLTVQIEEVATASGVTQTSIVPGTPGPPPGGGDYSVYPITMSFEGTYEELQQFTLGVRNLVRLVTINDITYEEAPEGTTPAPGVERLLRVTIEAEVYFQPSVAPSDVPSGEAPTAPVAPDAAERETEQVEETDGS